MKKGYTVHIYSKSTLLMEVYAGKQRYIVNNVLSRFKNSTILWDSAKIYKDGEYIETLSYTEGH